MKYIFEDNSLDPMSKLFCMNYDSSVVANFCYVESNSKTYEKVLELMKNGEDIVFVFLDTIPANGSIHQVYKDLRRAGLKYKGRVVVFPIVCAEYYFIKFLSKHSNLVKDSKTVKFCLNKNFYKNSKIYAGSEVFAKTYEKFCKLMLIHKDVFIDCLHSKKSSNNFYSVDCICSDAVSSCVNLSLKDKAFEYLSAYPCFPSRSNYDETVLDMQGIISLHRQLVDEFNAWSDRYKTIDVGNEKKYFNIKYIL